MRAVAKSPAKAMKAHQQALRQRDANNVLAAFLEGYEGRERRLRLSAILRAGHDTFQQDAGPLALVCRLEATIGRASKLIRTPTHRDHAEAHFKRSAAA